MDLNVSAVDDDMSDVIVTMQIPARKHSYFTNKWGDSSSVVIVPSDSEDDDDDDITIISEVPPVMQLDNDDCLLESYQPGTSSNGALTLLTVKPIMHDTNAADVRPNHEILQRADKVRENVIGDHQIDLVLTSPPADMSLLLFSGHSNVTRERQDVFSGCDSYINSSVMAGRKRDSSSCYSLDNSLAASMSVNSRISVDGSLKFDDSGLLFNVSGKISLMEEKNDVDTNRRMSNSSQRSKGAVLSDDRPSALGSANSFPSSGSNLNADVVKENSSSVNSHGHSQPGTAMPVESKQFVGDYRTQITFQNSSDYTFDIASRSISTNGSEIDLIGGKRMRHSQEHTASSDPARKVLQTTKSFHPCHAYRSPLRHRSGSQRHHDTVHLSHGVVKKERSSIGIKPQRSEPSISGNENQLSSDVVCTKLSSMPCSSRSSCATSEQGTEQSSSHHLSANAVQETARCCCCTKLASSSGLSFCMAGHPSCGNCLQNHIKTLLASGTKGSVKCLKEECSYFYATSQLSNCLPRMVVEILEEKYHREFCDELPDELGTRSFTVGSVDRAGLEEGLHEIPKNWEPMKSDEPFRKVELGNNSEEYNWVSEKFSQSMDGLRSRITRIYRVQNHVLWQFYVVRRRQMARDLGSSNPVDEKHLFHGTSRRAVDAICLNNFDWRLCGSHGTMYGQGSYFAKDAAYSHMYTDPPPGHSCRHAPLRPGSGSMQFVLHSPYYRRSLLRAGSFVHRLMRSVHGPKPHPTVPSISSLQSAGTPLPAHQSVAPDMGLGTLSRLFSSFLQPAHQPRTVTHGSVHPAGSSSSSASATQQAGGSASGLVAPQKQGCASTVGSTTNAVSPYYPMCSAAAHSKSSAASASHYANLPYMNNSRGPNAPTGHHALSAYSDTSIASSSAVSHPVHHHHHHHHSSFGTAQPAPHPAIPPPPAHLPHPAPAIPLPAHLPVPHHPPAIPLPAHLPPRLAPATSTTWCPGPSSETQQPIESHHVMFLSRVLVGESTVGCSEFRKPPPIDPSRPYDRCYDTCVNRLVNPSIYVVFNSSQCYPEYIIEYTNRVQSRPDCI